MKRVNYGMIRAKHNSGTIGNFYWYKVKTELHEPLMNLTYPNKENNF